MPATSAATSQASEVPFSASGVDESARDATRELDETLGHLADRDPYDLVVGINCLNVETTIVHVLSSVCEGLREHFPVQRSLVIVMDGGSEDKTRELASFYPVPHGIDKEVVLQGHGPGKGNGIRSVLDIASITKAHACAFIDGDLISVRPSWLDHMLRPIVSGLADLSVPYYLRDKWDGVITNHLCYPFTAALYGSSVRQPLGGEYALSRRYVDHVRGLPEVPGDFGIDIFLTTTAPAERFRSVEVPLGIRVHTSTIEYTDPRKTLHRMYLEVVGEMFDLALRYEPTWRASQHDATVLLVENIVPYYGRLPPTIDANEQLLLDIFREGVEAAPAVYQRDVASDVQPSVAQALKGDGLEQGPWVQTAYDLAARYMVLTEQALSGRPSLPAGAAGRRGGEREQVLDLMAALGMGRYLRFVRDTRGMDLAEATQIIRSQAKSFHDLRPQFVARIDELRAQADLS